MKKILFIGGSLNQTTMMHKVSLQLSGYDCYFSAYYCDGFEKQLLKLGILDFTVMGGKFKKASEEYFTKHKLKIDYEGKNNDYELVVTGSDLIVPKNIMDKKVVLVQEGMTDPEDAMYHIVKNLKLPRYLGSTSTTGLSDCYDIFCVASDGYKKHFINKGVKEEKIAVTGIPNFDNCAAYLNNDFPHKDYVLACTSDARETYKVENRKKFIQKAVEIAGGRQLIFKLHPNEMYERAAYEIDKYAPGALVYQNANTNEMIANCETLITKYSTVVYVGLALGKEVYSEFPIEELKELTPLQNGGTSAKNIANICRKLIDPTSNVNDKIPPHIIELINKSYNRAI